MSKFDLIGGVGILGFISPMDTMDTYAVIDPLYGIDGLRNVDTIAEMNAIPFERRRAGMLVGVNGGDIFYKLKNVSWVGDITDWEEFTLNNNQTLNFSDKETPSGVIDGNNKIFTLQNTPTPNSEHLYLNGLLLESGGEDYVSSGSTITFIDAPLPGDRLRCSYRY